MEKEENSPNESETLILGEKYNCKNGYYQILQNSSITYMEPLLIDYSVLTSTSPKASEELQKLKSALTSWGCLQFINHGIQTSLLDEVKEASRQFFALPMEEKQKYEMLPNGNNGFSAGKALNRPSNKKACDFSEGLSLTTFPDDHQQLQFWPQFPPHFKKVVHEYTTKLTTMFDVLFKLVFKLVNVDEKKLTNQYGKNKQINTRFNYYPRCPDLNQVLGLKPHADFSAFTLLLQDEEGLQVLKDDQWFMVPVIPDALFLNLGDPIEIMSNGMYKSAVHRAVTNTEKERFSIAAFWDSDRDLEVGPLDELINADHPQVYQRLSLKHYNSKFFQHYESGIRPIYSLRL